MYRKQTALVLAVFATVYPTITLALFVLGEIAPMMAMPLRTALMSAIMVPVMTLIVIPAIRRGIDRHFA
ncbi:MAG: hypothetical protein AAGE90_02665 [Pseudomonadota bacterium]